MARREGIPERIGRTKGRRFEVLENKDGAKHEIRYESGNEHFFAAPEKGLEFVSEDVSEVRKELKEYMAEHDSLVWEPIIEVDRRPWDNDDLGLEYERKFRAKKVNGEFVYRNFDVDREPKHKRPKGFSPEDAVEGHPGAITSPDNSSARIKYTPKRWTFLRSMTHRIIALKKAMKEFVEQGEAELIECLEGRKVFTPVMTKFLSAPEDD